MGAADLVRGFAIGLSIAAPVGPISLLCIRRTLADGRLVGLVSGLGAATADATYGAVAGFGLTAVSSAVVGAQGWLRLVGGAFLCWLGVMTIRARPSGPVRTAAPSPRGLLGAYASVLGLTLTNPLTILSFAALFAGLGLADAGGDWGAAASMVLGVFAGSGAWWLVLALGAGAMRARLTTRAMTAVNVVSGGAILAFGLGSLLSLALSVP